MKKIFTLIAGALLSLGANAQTEKYAVAEGFTPTDNQEVDATTSIKLKFGADGSWKVAASVGENDPRFSDADGFPLYVVGGNNPKTSADKKFTPGNAATLPQKGCYYIFTASQSGDLEIAMKLNNNKIFYIADGADGHNYSPDAKLTDVNGTEVQLGSDLKVTSALTGFAKIGIQKDQSLYVFCDGSKLSLFGFRFTPGEVVEDTGTPHEAQVWDFTSKLSEADKTNITADTNWEIIENKDQETDEVLSVNYKNTQKLENAVVKANNVELELTKGLKFNAGAGKFEYYDGERLAHGGNGHGPIVPNCAKDDIIKMRYKISESDRGFSAGNAEVTEGTLIGDAKGTFEVTLKVLKKGDVTFASVSGADILGLAVNADLPAITDGISTLKVVDKANGAIYNLAGQKVSNDFKGLVIKNGKKFVIK